MNNSRFLFGCVFLICVGCGEHVRDRTNTDVHLDRGSEEEIRLPLEIRILEVRRLSAPFSMEASFRIENNTTEPIAVPLYESGELDVYLALDDYMTIDRLCGGQWEPIKRIDGARRELRRQCYYVDLGPGESVMALFMGTGEGFLEYPLPGDVLRFTYAGAEADAVTVLPPEGGVRDEHGW
jgi:hypothetical protein